MNSTVTPDEIIRVIAPLDPILADPDVWEIMVDGHERVLVEREGRLEEVASPFSSASELRAMVDGLFGLYGIVLDAAHPVGYLRLPDHTRCTAILPPNAVDGTHLVLRRVVGPRPTWDVLFEHGAVPQRARDLLAGALRARANILVSGGPASGKTTMAGLIAGLIPPDERVIVVESSYEMHVVHPRVVRLEAGGPAGLGIEDVLTAAQRMRPDRLIVGDLTGPFAASVLRRFGSGYNGSLTMIHSTSVTDALARLESLCLMADLGLGLAEIRRLVAAGIQLITYQERLPSGGRRLVEIVELCGIESARYVLQPLMRYDREADAFVFTDAVPGWER